MRRGSRVSESSICTPGFLYGIWIVIGYDIPVRLSRHAAILAFSGHCPRQLRASGSPGASWQQQYRWVRIPQPGACCNSCYNAGKKSCFFTFRLLFPIAISGVKSRLTLVITGLRQQYKHQCRKMTPQPTRIPHASFVVIILSLLFALRLRSRRTEREARTRASSQGGTALCKTTYAN